MGCLSRRILDILVEHQDGSSTVYLDLVGTDALQVRKVIPRTDVDFEDVKPFYHDY
jgi:hypothetical protein